MTVVCKLGGSVITEKSRRETVDEPRLAAIGDAIAASRPDRLVIVHGGGSFGHPAAHEHGLSRTAGSSDAPAVGAVHRAMTRLNGFVIDVLYERSVPVVPFRPLSNALRDRDGALRLHAAVVRAALDEGFVPVLHGDVVVHRGHGSTILSGDELVVALADMLEADRVGVCSTVPGVLDEGGSVIESIERYDDVASVLGDSDATDVTGGMAAKVDALLSMSMPAAVFGPDDVRTFLEGGMPGTRIG